MINIFSFQKFRCYYHLVSTSEEFNKNWMPFVCAVETWKKYHNANLLNRILNLSIKIYIMIQLLVYFPDINKATTIWQIHKEISSNKLYKVLRENPHKMQMSSHGLLNITDHTEGSQYDSLKHIPSWSNSDHDNIPLVDHICVNVSWQCGLK